MSVCGRVLTYHAMATIQLIHWNATEAAPRVAALRSAGFTVRYEANIDHAIFKDMHARPPGAIVIDLTRMPSHGRDVAMGFRASKVTRAIPLVFVGGDETKVAALRERLPDATYTDWVKITRDLLHAIKNPPKNPIAVGSVLAGYSGTPLPKKLGIKEGTAVGLAGAPENFIKTLGALPENVNIQNISLTKSGRGNFDLLILFVNSTAELNKSLDGLEGRADFQSLWFAWRKKASGIVSDVNEKIVRERAMARGLVDYKICAIDEVWSGLRFARRKK